MAEEKIGERIAKLEEASKGESRRITKLEEENEVLGKLTTLVEMQTDINRETKDQMKSFDTTLININTNLIQLNTSQNHLKSEMNTIGERVNSIETSQEGNKIDIPKLMVRIIIGLFMLIPTIFCAWLLTQIGLK